MVTSNFLSLRLGFQAQFVDAYSKVPGESFLLIWYSNFGDERLERVRNPMITGYSSAYNHSDYVPQPISAAPKGTLLAFFGGRKFYWVYTYAVGYNNFFWKYKSVVGESIWDAR